MGFTDFILRYKIEGDNSDLKKKVQDSEKSFDGLSRRVQTGAKSAASEVSNIVAALTGDRLSGAASQVTSLANAFGAIPGAAGLAVGSFAAIGVAAVGAGTALYGLTKSAEEYGSVIHDASDKTGLHAETLSAMDVAAKQSGTSLDQVTGALAKFAKNVSAGKDELKAFGITPKEAIADLDGSLAKVFKRIEDAKPGYEQIVLAQKAFGKSGADLLPFIKQFDGDLPGLIKKAKELGLTLTDEDARAADVFGDQMVQLEAQMAAAGRTIGFQLMPVFLDLSQQLSSWLGDNKSEVRSWGDAFVTAVQGVANAVQLFITDLQLLDEWSSHVMNTDRYYQLADKVNMLEQKDKNFWNGTSIKPYSGTGAQVDELTTPFIPTAKQSPFPDFTEKSGGGGGRIKPPKQTDSEFRKFFTDFGFQVTRTFGDALNKGSLHPLGLAADVSVRGKSTDQIAKLIAEALEKGYRLVDERKKIPGVNQTGPHLHFERNQGDKASVFQDASMYGGVPVDFLKGLDSKRLGKGAAGSTALAAFTQAQVESEKQILASVQSSIDETIAAEKQAADDRMEIRRAEADKEIELIQSKVDKGEMTEREAVERTGNIKMNLLLAERAETGNLISTKENIQKLNLLDIQIQTQEISNARELVKIEQQRREERNKSWHEYIENLKKEQEIQEEQRQKEFEDQRRKQQQARQKQAGFLGESVLTQFDQVGNAVTTLSGAFDDLKKMGGEALGQFAQGIGSVVENFVLMGTAGPHAMRKVLASVLASVSAQAAVQAIMELAYGFAALTPWGAAIYGPAPLHFKAAALFGAVAVVSGLAGRAVAGNSFSGGGSGGSSKNTSTTNPPQINQNPTPYSRASSDAYISGSRDHAVAAAIERHTQVLEKLHSKIDAMKPGDVLTRGVQQKPGLIGHTVVKDIGRNANIGTGILKAAGQRR